MTDKPDLLAGYETEAEFAKRHNLSPRTVARYRNEPDGLPFMFLGRAHLHPPRRCRRLHGSPRPQAEHAEGRLAMSTFEPAPSEDALRDLRQLSAEPGDGGELIGADPRKVPLEILSRYHRERNPLKAIRVGAWIAAAAIRPRSASAPHAAADALKESDDSGLGHPLTGGHWKLVTALLGAVVYLYFKVHIQPDLERDRH